MQNMWNTINNNLLVMGHNKQLFGPNTTQKRQFGCDYPKIANIVADKAFNNPNFVNKDYPRTHSYQKSNFSVSSSICQSDSPNSTNIYFSGTPRNSSQTIIETIKEKNLDVIRPISGNTEIEIKNFVEPCENKPVMCNKRAHLNRRKSKKSRLQHKSCEKSVKAAKQNINEMMEVDLEPLNYANTSDISMSPKEYHSLTLSDFLVKSNLFEKEDPNVGIESEDLESDQSAKFSVSSPSSVDYILCRERTISVADSEDSFIVFESGTDDELEFSDNSQEDDDESNEDDNCEETDEEELHSSPPVVPRKKVRFADDSELCQVHPMIMWSYAYQKARIGPWQKFAVDRVRFKDHIRNLEEKIKPVLDAKHREQIFKDRFQDLQD